jgi:hypothetical protein
MMISVEGRIQGILLRLKMLSRPLPLPQNPLGQGVMELDGARFRAPLHAGSAEPAFFRE